MDVHGPIRNRHLPVDPSSWTFLLALEMRNDKELAEDWIQDKDGILVFVRSSYLTVVIIIFERTSFFFFYPLQSPEFSLQRYWYLSSGITTRCYVVPLWRMPFRLLRCRTT